MLSLTLSFILITESEEKKSPKIKHSFPSLSDVSAFSCTMKQGYKNYVGKYTSGIGSTLKMPLSSVQITIPDNLHGWLKGYVELDPADYIDRIPDNECIIAPLPVFTYIDSKLKTFCVVNEVPKFKITLKHTVKNKRDLEFIRVCHGDINTGMPFNKIPRKNDARNDIYWEADTEYITITTTHFSQFICTTCKRNCDDKMQLFLSGDIKNRSSNLTEAETKVFLCPSLYTIIDYRNVSHLNKR